MPDANLDWLDRRTARVDVGRNLGWHRLSSTKACQLPPEFISFPQWCNGIPPAPEHPFKRLSVSGDFRVLRVIRVIRIIVDDGVDDEWVNRKRAKEKRLADSAGLFSVYLANR